jgi:cytochrome c
MLRFCAAAIAILALTEGARAGKLLDAVKAGDLPGAEAALSQGADVNEKTGVQTPLVAAVRAANHEMIALLLDKGADPNKGAGSNAPLSMASGMSDPAIVQMLLEKGADARFSTNTNTALHRAAESGCLKCTELLVAAGADVNALTSDGIPAIHLAKRAGHADIAALLLANGYEPPPLAPISPALKDADDARGKSVFDKTCAACHRLTESFIHNPPLGGVVGRARASVAGQQYSDALRAVGGLWNYEELNAFIANPRAVIPGTAMGFPGLPDGGDRADLILYLRNQSADPLPLP